jgi:TM2 domain-containing membrane protein YozV
MDQQPTPNTPPAQPEQPAAQPPAPVSPQPGQPPAQPLPATDAKSATTAGLLGIFLGSVGAHDFYLGYKKFAIIHCALFGGGILLMIISGIVAASSVTNIYSYANGSLGASLAISGILSAVGGAATSGSGIWGLVTGIMALSKSGQYAHDANGTPLI